MSRIYAYWEGDDRHWYYDLCWDTVIRHNPNAVLLTRTDVEDVLGRLPQELDLCYVTHRVDWIRKAFIYKVGGLWLDLDFICWQCLEPLVALADAFDYVGYREWHGTGYMDNFFVARAGSPILETAMDYAMQEIRQNPHDLQWLATNAYAINHALREHKWKAWMEIPTHLISPISVMDRDWFAANADDSINVHSFVSFGQITSFHGIGDWIKSRFRSPEELLKSQTRLGALFRRALCL